MSNKFNYEEIQKLLISSLFNQQHKITEAGTIIDPKFFKNENYREIYIALQDLYGKSEAEEITEVELYSNLIDKGLKPDTQFIVSLNSTDTSQSPLALAELLKKKYVQSETKELLTKQLKEIDENPDVLSVISESEEKLANLASDIIPKSKIDFAETVNEVVAKASSENEVDLDVVPLFNPQMNKVLNGGWQKGSLNTIGARTGVGKTVFAINSAEAACAAGKTVLFFSLEMTRQELAERMLSSVSGVASYKLKPGAHRTPSENERISQATETMAGFSLVVEDDSDITIDYIRSKAKAQAASPEGLDLIIVDYLQLINPGSNRGHSNREQQVAAMSRGLKVLAKDLQVPIMILVQLNRESKDEDENRLPSKADIRESAGIAADSNVVLIIHRKYRDESPDPKALFIIDKNRGGQADKKFQVRCVLEKSMFVDVEPEEDEVEVTRNDLTNLDEEDTNILDNSFIDNVTENDDEFDSLFEEL